MSSVVQRFRRIREALAPLKSLLVVPDRRVAQEELDVSALYSLTSYNRLASPTEKDVECLIAEAERRSVDEKKQQLQLNVHEQVRKICAALDNVFVPGRQLSLDTVTSPRRSGLLFAVSKPKLDIEIQKVLGPPETLPLSDYDVSLALKNQLGYTLRLKESEIQEPHAGEGLFLEGVAKKGTVLALYPGVVYSPSKYRYIPGYPQIDTDNPFLISRYDGVVIDGKPWGRGGRDRVFWEGLEDVEQGDDVEDDVSADVEGDVDGDETKAVVVTGEGEAASKEITNCDEKFQGGSQLKIELLERRNPLALAHYANHPPKGKMPNVMICPYDFAEHEVEMRPYIPNIRFEDDLYKRMERKGKKWVRETSNRVPDHLVPLLLRTLVFVATRDVCDEEVLLNYRLSNPKKRPHWYHPVDEEEDERRWAL